MTKVEALSELLLANLAYSDELIDDDELRRIDRQARDIIGDDNIELLCEMCVAEHWSPEDMGRADAAAVLKRII